MERLARSEAKRRLVADAQVRAAKGRRELREGFREAAQSALQSAAKSPPQPPAVEEGATVKLAELGAVGRVTRKLADGGFEVQAGSLKLRVAAADIAEVLPASQAVERLPARVTVQHPLREPKELSEINVIGKTSEEAQEAVDKLLDDALLAEVTRVRVIHGHGKNVLRRALWQMFRRPSFGRALLPSRTARRGGGSDHRRGAGVGRCAMTKCRSARRVLSSSRPSFIAGRRNSLRTARWLSDAKRALARPLSNSRWQPGNGSFSAEMRF